jgi:hypothetical protein
LKRIKRFKLQQNRVETPHLNQRQAEEILVEIANPLSPLCEILAVVMAIMRVHPTVVPVAGVVTLVHHAVPILGGVAATGVHVSGGLVVGMVVMRVHPIVVPVAGMVTLVHHAVPILGVVAATGVHVSGDLVVGMVVMRVHPTVVPVAGVAILVRHMVPILGVVAAR